jgi:MazG family protein
MMHDFNSLLDVMHKLRNECPWDKEQSLASLRSYLIEEAYECLDAMLEAENGKPEALIEELGDLLLQICFQSEILSEEAKRPIIHDVIDGITRKLIRRHPHIFSDTKAANTNEVLENWEEIKKKEKGLNVSSIFHDFKAIGPSLQTALKIGSKSKRVRFDWENAQEVWTQTKSEWLELENAQSKADKEEELGDLLFCLAQWARHQDLDPEVALQSANQKFLRRFRWMEIHSEKNGLNFKELSRDEKEELWKKAKANTSSGRATLPS